MTNLPDVTPRNLPVPAPNADDLRGALLGIPDGWYRSADLLPRYAAWAEQNGREVPSLKTLGEAIRREFRPQRRNMHGHVSAWYLSEAVLTHRDWFKPNPDTHVSTGQPT